MALIYIVEDDVNIREIETFSLKNSGYTVMDFECAKDFYHKLSDKVPDLILLDIMLPKMNGFEVCQQIREFSSVPIVMLTAKGDDMDKILGLEYGADDYLTKPFGVMELISRVKALLRRSMNMDESKILSLGEISIDNEKHRVSVQGQPCELTYKEFELLKLLLQNVGIVLSRDVIMERVWGVDFEGESRTLDMHIKTLRQKLGESGKRIKTVRNVGYRLE